MNFTRYSNEIKLIIITSLVTIFFWLFFYFRFPLTLGFPTGDIYTLFANYDGPNYMIIAKCGYNPDCIRSNFSLPLPLEYYPAHLPGYPLTIRLLSYLLPTTWAMLVSTLLGSILLSVVSFHLFRQFYSSKLSFFLSIFLLVFPPRLLSLRLIGSPEPWYLSFIILSLLAHRSKQYFSSAIYAALAIFFKSPGILLLGSFGLYFLYQVTYLKHSLLPTFTKYLAFLLVPIVVIYVFWVYYIYTGDFFAYFHSGDNIHLYPFPYPVFLSFRSWIGTIWLEDIIYILFLAFIGLFLLFKKTKSPIFWFPLLYVLATVFVGHRDISRYIIPSAPFLVIGFGKYLSRPCIKIALLLIIPAIFLYTINFLIGNTAPITNWAPYI